MRWSFFVDTYVIYFDWLFDGVYVVVVLIVGSALSNKVVSESSIVCIFVFLGDMFGVLEVLVPSEGSDDSFFFSSYLFDSCWIVYVRADGKSKDNEILWLFFVWVDGS